MTNETSVARGRQRWRAVARWIVENEPELFADGVSMTEASRRLRAANIIASPSAVKLIMDDLIEADVLHLWKGQAKAFRNVEGSRRELPTAAFSRLIDYLSSIEHWLLRRPSLKAITRRTCMEHHKVNHIAVDEAIKYVGFTSSRNDAMEPDLNAPIIKMEGGP